MSTTVVGLFSSREVAQNAAQALEQQGVSRSDISIGGKDSALGGTAESGWDKFLDMLHLHTPTEDSDYYKKGLQSGQVLLSVVTPDTSADSVATMLRQYGASDIDEQMAAYSASSGTSASRTVDTGDTAVIPVVQEELQVGKRTVQSGGVRVYQHVTERPVQEQVTLREEQVVVDRRPVDRAVTDADNAFQEGTLELKTTAEQAVVAKNARVIEEVVVGKSATDRSETIEDTVRRTNVEVVDIDKSQTTSR